MLVCQYNVIWQLDTFLVHAEGVFVAWFNVKVTDVRVIPYEARRGRSEQTWPGISIAEVEEAPSLNLSTKNQKSYSTG